MAPASRSTTVPKMGCGYAVCSVMAVAGIALLVVAQSSWRTGRAGEAWMTGTVGALLCFGSVAIIAPMQRDIAAKRARLHREQSRPDAPWTWEEAWLSGAGIRQSGRRHGRAFVVFGLAAFVMASPAFFVLRDELRGGNYAVLLVLVFPAVGGGLLFAAARDAWRRRKYGVARFVPAALPIPLGGELAGMVLVDRPVVASGPGRIALDCWCATRENANRSSRDEVVAHTEREIVPGDWATTSGESRLFVRLPVRGGAATTMAPPSIEADSYEWRLRVETPTPGADFVAEFVLPVFPVANSGEVTAHASAAGSSVTAVKPIERGEIWRAAGIREEPQPGAVNGRALVFPTGVGRRLITAPLIMALVFGALAAVLWLSPLPGIIAVFLGIFALLPALVLKPLWSGGGERVWIEGPDICVEHGHRLRRIARRDVVGIETSRNVGVGAQQFYRVVARVKPRREGFMPPRVQIASMVLGDEAAGQATAWIEAQVQKGP